MLLSSDLANCKRLGLTFFSEGPTILKINDIIPDILIKFWLALFGAKTISLLIKPAPFGAKISWAFHLKCSSPFYSWSASPDRTSLNFLFINSCFGFNKSLTNLTSLRQHHLQYTGGLAETQGLLLPSLYCDAHQRYSSTHTDILVLFRTFL